MKWTDALELAGMTPWACSFEKDGRRYAITLYGTSQQQVLNDNCDQLAGLRVDGELVCYSKPEDDPKLM